MPDLSIALVTCARLPNLPPDEQLTIRALGALGIAAKAAVWSDPSVDWNDFDAIVLRSTWDYHDRLGEFFAWIAAIESLGVPLWNPAPLVRWNADKKYLGELGARGVNIVPTRWADDATDASLAEIMDRTGWRDVVVKPAVSATAKDTFRVHRGETEPHEARFRALRSAARMMVQPVVWEIMRDGEWSLVFFGGEFSHALKKRPAPGDFRVQDEHGGYAVAESPPERLVADARRVLAMIEWPWAYARVDCCEVEGRLLLMELEMLEPTFYLDLVPGAADRFAAIITRII